MIDRLRQMAIFAKTIDHGSFRGAAKELRLSPSVVSHHVSQLEEHLGIALMYRSTRRLKLTREGERLLKTTRNMLETVEGDLAELSATASEPSGEIRLTAPSVLSQSYFTDAIASVAMTYPRISFHLDYSDMRRELIRDGFDIAIRMGVSGKNSATSRMLFKVDRKVIAATDYLKSRSHVEEPSELTEWDWLELLPVQNVPLTFTHEDNERSVKINPRARIQSSDAQALYRLSRAGAGLAVIPEFLATKDVDSGRTQWVLPDWHLDQIGVYANWPANAPRNGLVHLVLNELGAQLHKPSDRSEYL